MGSLTSRPKVPASIIPAVQTVYVPAPSATTSIASSPAATGSVSSIAGGTNTPIIAPASAMPTAAEIQQNARANNLLQSSRGALSTVLTGFRGVLDDNIAPGQAKTLLGE